MSAEAGLSHTIGTFLAINGVCLERFGTITPEEHPSIPAELRDKMRRQRVKVDKLQSPDPELHTKHLQALIAGMRLVMKKLDPTAINPSSIKLADLYERQRRDRQPYLVGQIGGFWLQMIARHNPEPGEPKATLFVSPVSTAGAGDSKPLPPVWCAKTSQWLGPTHEAYPGFHDDTAAAVADLQAR